MIKGMITKVRTSMTRAHLGAIGIVTVVSVTALGLATEVAAGPPKLDLGLLAAAVQLVQHEYVRPVDSKELTEYALKGMLAHLDPHSAYMTQQEFRESIQEMSGKFGGIGLEIADHAGLPTVISPIDDTPAAHAGLQPGDVIASIDGHSTHGEDLSIVVRQIRGKPGTSVTLAVSRGSKNSFDVSLTRSIIRVNSVKSKLEPDDIGYARVSQFAEDTPTALKQAIAKLKQDAGGKLRGFVLDLRDDPGGLVYSAVDVSGDFLDHGTIVSIRDRRQSDDKVFSAPANGDLLQHTPIVVLINGASASASEIVAGALQDHHRATLMGTRSFGKGSVQSIIPLGGHGALRLTTGLYYTPSGRSIQDEGISPDVVVEARKDEQAASPIIWRESELHGAFANPGPLAASKARAQKSPAKSEADSRPIKQQLIGTADDAQLNAALKLLEQPNGPNATTSDRKAPI
jgi:carboxyl-terminal processing protease